MLHRVLELERFSKQPKQQKMDMSLELQMSVVSMHQIH